MRVGIEALEFDQFGGGQIVSAEFIRLLQEAGHHVIVFCNKKFDSDQRLVIQRKWRLRPFEMVYVPTMGNFSITSFLFSIIQIKYHLDCYFSVGLLILTKHQSARIPTFRYALAPHTPFLFKKYRNMLRYGKSIYYIFRVAELFFNLILDTSGSQAKHRLVLSGFIKKKYKQAYNIDYDVLYPPVYQDDLKQSGRKDEKSIVCLGRFDVQKNYPSVVKIAERYPELRFRILGGYVPSPANQRLLKFLLRASRRLTNLSVEVNTSREHIVESLCTCRYLLHVMKDEHFGIAIVEALACGMTPIVAKNSGPDEIIGNGKYGQLFNNLEELTENFKRFLLPKDETMQRARASEFSLERFRAETKKHMANFFSMFEKAP